MITVSVLAAYVLGMTFFPGPTRAVIKALIPLLGTMVAALFVFWRVFPSGSGTFRRL